MINAIDSPVRHIFIKGSIADKSLVDEVFAIYKPSIVVNLAAQAGVRYSIDHPDVYIESNLIGFYNILEACRHSYDNADTDENNEDSDCSGAYKGVLPEDYDFEGHRQLVGMQPGDVPVTYADCTGLERDYGFTPKIGIREGLRRFAEWYKVYYG